MNAQDEEDEDLKRLQQHCDQLSEHFDTVQIFVTRYDSKEGTINAQWGSGNWFARKGQVDKWATKENERICREVDEDNP